MGSDAQVNVAGWGAIVSPAGPRNPTETVRAGLATGFVPLASRNETMTRFAPTPNSDEAITGRIVSVGLPDPVAGDALAEGAPVEPEVAQPELMTVVSTAAPIVRRMLGFTR